MRRSDQPGAGKRAHSRRVPTQKPLRLRRRENPTALGLNMFAAIMDERNFVERSWQPGAPVRLIKESSERMADGRMIVGTAERSYGYVVRVFKKQNEQQRRAGVGEVRVVVKLVNGQEAVTDPWNLERVTNLDLLAACAGEG